MSMDFWQKSSPFGQHIPACLNMWVPPPGFNTLLNEEVKVTLLKATSLQLQDCKKTTKKVLATIPYFNFSLFSTLADIFAV